MTEILIVEDDIATSKMLTMLLQRAGYDTHPAFTAAEAEAGVRQGVDLVVLDLGLPDRDGIDLCRDIRSQRPGLPILVVSARTSEPDAVIALDIGADDYLMKPFRSLEFLARVRALLRRVGTGDLLSAGDIALDIQAMRVTVQGKPVALTRKEFEILALLMRNAGQVVPRAAMLGSLWSSPLATHSKALDMHVSALRRKLAEAGSSDLLRTLRGVGFRLDRQARD